MKTLRLNSTKRLALLAIAMLTGLATFAHGRIGAEDSRLKSLPRQQGSDAIKFASGHGANSVNGMNDGEIVLRPTREEVRVQVNAGSWGSSLEADVLEFASSNPQQEVFITFDLSGADFFNVNDYKQFNAVLRLFFFSMHPSFTSFDVVLYEGNHASNIQKGFDIKEINVSECDDLYNCWIELNVTQALKWSVKQQRSYTSSGSLNFTIRVSAQNQQGKNVGSLASSEYSNSRFSPTLTCSFQNNPPDSIKYYSTSSQPVKKKHIVKAMKGPRKKVKKNNQGGISPFNAAVRPNQGIQYEVVQGPKPNNRPNQGSVTDKELQFYSNPVGQSTQFQTVNGPKKSIGNLDFASYNVKPNTVIVPGPGNAGAYTKPTPGHGLGIEQYSAVVPQKTIQYSYGAPPKKNNAPGRKKVVVKARKGPRNNDKGTTNKFTTVQPNPAMKPNAMQVYSVPVLQTKPQQENPYQVPVYENNRPHQKNPVKVQVYGNGGGGQVHSQPVTRPGQKNPVKVTVYGNQPNKGTYVTVQDQGGRGYQNPSNVDKELQLGNVRPDDTMQVYSSGFYPTSGGQNSGPGTDGANNGPGSFAGGANSGPSGPNAGGGNQGPSGPSVSYGAMTGPNGPNAAYGQNQGPNGPVAGGGNQGPNGPSHGGGNQGPKGPSVSYGAMTGPNGPNAAYGQNQGPNGPVAGGGNQGPNGPSHGGGNQGPKGPSVTYGPNGSPNGPNVSYNGQSGPSAGGVSYGAQSGPEGPQVHYNGQSGPSAGDVNYGPNGNQWSGVGPNGTSFGGSGKWYMNYDHGKCVRDCAEGQGCGGVGNFWDIMYDSQDTCCSSRNFWNANCMDEYEGEGGGEQ